MILIGRLNQVKETRDGKETRDVGSNTTWQIVYDLSNLDHGTNDIDIHGVCVTGDFGFCHFS